MRKAALLASVSLSFVALLVGAATVVRTPKASAGGSGDERIRFQITAVEEGAAGRKVISDAAVEGPAGTDFNVNLQDGRFRMSARFLSDLEPGGGGLTLRARLETRRLYGYSEAGLPLYEEDAQRHTLRLGFDEAVVLLPFGGGGDGGRLSIEIKPARAGITSGDQTTPEITISKPSPGGAISVEATKVPHDFRVDATLLEDGREVARGSADCLLEEPVEVLLRPTGTTWEGKDTVPLALNLTVEGFDPGPGPGRAAVRFDVLGEETGRPKARAALARNWAGVTNLGSELSYDLGHSYPGTAGRRYELKLRVSLGPDGRVGRRD